jgi:hypothetical protein
MIQTECKGCGQKLKLVDDMAGKRARCPSCGDPVKVPGASPAVSSPERPASNMPPPERPRPTTPPPEKRRFKTPSPRRPVPDAQPAAPPPDNPFDFMNPAPYSPTASTPPPRPSQPAPVAQVAPAANAGLVFAQPIASPIPRASAYRPPRSFARPFASYGALLGAALAATTLFLLAPSEDAITEGLARLARGKLTVEHIRGAVVGLIGGLLIGSAVVAIVGRSLQSITVGCLLLIAGAVLGAIRQSSEGELTIMLLLAAAYTGVIAGAALGGLIGAMVDLARKEH